jgi:hypothetical protein
MSEIVSVRHSSPCRRGISAQPWYTASHIRVLAGGAGNRLLSRSGFPVAFSAPLLILYQNIPGCLFWLRPQAAFCRRVFPLAVRFLKVISPPTSGVNAIIHRLKERSRRYGLTMGLAQPLGPTGSQNCRPTDIRKQRARTSWSVSYMPYSRCRRSGHFQSLQLAPSSPGTHSLLSQEPNQAMTGP